MKVLLTGAGGQLGQASVFRKLAASHNACRGGNRSDGAVQGVRWRPGDARLMRTAQHEELV